MKTKVMFAVSFVVFFASVVLAAERVAVLCIGEHRNQCGPETTIHNGCGASAESAAKTFCTIQTQNGPQIVPHFIDHLSSTAGNRCGYNMYRITCQTDRP